MRRRLRVLVADNDRAFAHALRIYMEGMDDLECAGCVYNGADALRCIKEMALDAIVLDLAMPYMDGVDVLREIQLLALEDRPSVFVVTAIGGQPTIQKRLYEMGAQACLEKPYDCELLCQRIREAFLTPEQIHRQRVERTVVRVMLRLQLPSKGPGYDYMQRALQLVLFSQGNGWLLKDVAAVIAEENNTSVDNVLRALRAIVPKIFACNSRELQDLLRTAYCEDASVMSCRDFIARIGRAIRLKYGL